MDHPSRRTCLGAALCVLGAAAAAHAAEPIRIGFLWHMHQPRYVPGETIFGADASFSFSVLDVHNGRFGPYTTWPDDAVNAGSALPHLGAQVSFSGSLITNLNELEGAGVNGAMWSNWDATYAASQSNLTVLGNRRLEMIGFAHHHALLPLLDERDIRKQIQLHKYIHSVTFGSPYSRGIFPPETAFSPRIIPALAAEGIEWALVDNIHFDRACVGYPHTNASNLFPPNRADQINPNPEDSGGRWVQLQNLWAPSPVSVPFGYQPHRVQHIDPDTGAITTITAVPAARYEGNEDGRGGYGAFLYDQVMDAYLPDNTDPVHPMFVVLHHDGDNFGGGSEAYYHHNFQNMVDWVSGDPDYEVTTVQDYLDRFPPAPTDVIHIENGSWAGADNGDPEFKKWLGGDVSAGAVSPDINSWAVLVAARNRVYTLDDAMGGTTNMPGILFKTGSALDRAWSHLLEASASDYWYWDGTEVWDANVTTGSNLAVSIAEPAIAALGSPDPTPPTMLVPQRDPYNPGSLEWGPAPEPSDFEVWTLVDDMSGVAGVTLRWRADNDGVNPLHSIQNETYAGGPEVGAWNSVPMSAASVPTPPQSGIATRKATRYGAMITGQSGVLIDYFVEAVDTNGNTERSDIQHVWVGEGDPDPADARVMLSLDPARAGEQVVLFYDESGGPLGGADAVYVHVGYNGWSVVEDPDPLMVDPDGDGVWNLVLDVPLSATELNLAFNDANDNWDNNNGADWTFAVEGSDPDAGFLIDGVLDGAARPVALNNGIELWAAIEGSTLYIACTPAGAGEDRFLVLAHQPGEMVDAMWAKAGRVAQWDAFIGNESDNNWSGWFDADGSAQLASGVVLEGTIDLAAEFGSVPDAVHLAVLSYASADGSTLNTTNQVRWSLDADPDAEPDEFVRVELCAIGDAPCCAADINGDGVASFPDVGAFLGAFAAGDPIADFTGDGVVSFPDVGAFLAAFSGGCP